eukprot:1925001-Alexandrium_andersonii.AAC.1
MRHLPVGAPADPSDRKRGPAPPESPSPHSQRATAPRHPSRRSRGAPEAPKWGPRLASPGRGDSPPEARPASGRRKPQGAPNRTPDT